jgi:hypothetical protein
MVLARVLLGWVALQALVACSPAGADVAPPTRSSRQPLGQQASEAWVAQGALTTPPTRQLLNLIAVDGPRAIAPAITGVPVFERVRGSWRESEPIELPNTLDQATHVAVSDGTVALLVSLFVDDMEDHRELWLCHREAQRWVTTRVAADLDLEPAWGLALGPSLLVTSMWREGGGHDVLAFPREGTDLGPPELVYAADRDDYELFAVSGSQVLVSTQFAAAANGSEGIVKVLSRTKDGWKVSATLSAPEPGAVTFGRALAASPRRIIVGTATGEAYVFDRTETGFAEPLRLDMPDGNPRPADSVAISDEAALVGSPNVDVDGLPGVGVAYMAFATPAGFSAPRWLAPEHVLPRIGFGGGVALGDGQAFVTGPGDLRPQSFGRVFVYGACEADRDCAPGSYCSVRGTCTSQKTTGQACDIALDCREAGCRTCESTHCVDGFCCDGACDAQCEACGEPGAEGTCQPVSGPVRGERRPCDSDDTQCGGACDGRDPACSYPAPGTPCASQCQDGVVTPSLCDGVGSCQPSAPRACDGYACDGDACAVTCRRPEDCSADFACLANACVPLIALSCSEDGKTSRGPTGTSFCAPYRCDDSRGVCRTRCRATDECDAGYVCDTERHACTLERQRQSSDGCGCRLGARGAARPVLPAAALALLSWLVRRRKQGAGR